MEKSGLNVLHNISFSVSEEKNMVFSSILYFKVIAQNDIIIKFVSWLVKSLQKCVSDPSPRMPSH